MKFLVNYSSDSDDNEENDSNQDDCDDEKNQPSRRLPLPQCLLANLKKEEVVDNPCENEGRIRSFPHERGNWASLVYIPFERGEDMAVLSERLAQGVGECGQFMKPVSSPHISLTRTFVLLYHWIQEFVATVKTSVNSLPSFRLEFNDIDVYLNDEKTRTFLGVTVSTGYESLADIVRRLDTCLKQYNLPPFYQDGRFHMSVSWCVGDKYDLLAAALPKLRHILQSFLSEFPESSYIQVCHLECKVGNRIYKQELVTS